MNGLTFESWRLLIGHVQVAGVPSRHGPAGEELIALFLFDLRSRLGYTGHVGCGDWPRGDTAAGLGRFAPDRATGAAQPSPPARR